jgi:predicted secreted protein
VLPFGANSQHETGDVTPGTDASAPVRLYVLRRIAATSALAAIIFGCVYLYFGVYGKTLEDLLW